MGQHPVSKPARRVPRADPKPARRRSATKQAAILASTVKLLGTHGVEGASVERIAAAAGVGKQTIYRWWPSAAAVVMEAYRDRLLPPTRPVTQASVRHQVTGILLEIARCYRDPGNRRALISLVFAFETNPSLRDEFHQVVYGPWRKAALALLRVGQDRGEIRADADLESVVDALYGPLVYRLLIGHAPLDRAFVRALIKEVFRGLESRTPTSAGE